MVKSQPTYEPGGHQQEVQLHGEEASLYHEIPKGTLDSLIGHRVDREHSSVDFEVKYLDGSTKWKPESVIHENAPELVIDYWERNGGRNEATGLTEYHVLKILGVRNSGRGKKSEKHYLVQWVGYTDSEKDTTIERESKLRQICAPRWRTFKNMDSRNNVRKYTPNVREEQKLVAKDQQLDQANMSPSGEYFCI
ncbi:hypothetical protein FLAG1_07851 [Fusarium langsethiae]|uniref:Chromo domain-containing protein n=1 Tax=Fusarium langsethiae TaxID=179993 RepID=A0A0N1J2H7_FUSLA|nr:hypothetical protein FLAG1_07851 [Fusarium langsethiae]